MTSHPYRTPRWAWTALLLIWAVVLLVDLDRLAITIFGGP